MLKRKMTNHIRNWEITMPKRLFFCSGARQTGTTFTVRSYAKRRRNLPFIEVNFLEDEENAPLLKRGDKRQEASLKEALAWSRVTPSNRERLSFRRNPAPWTKTQ